MKKLWALCARKKLGHKRQDCFNDGGELCECECHEMTREEKELANGLDEFFIKDKLKP